VATPTSVTLLSSSSRSTSSCGQAAASAATPASVTAAQKLTLTCTCLRHCQRPIEASPLLLRELEASQNFSAPVRMRSYSPADGRSLTSVSGKACAISARSVSDTSGMPFKQMERSCFRPVNAMSRSPALRPRHSSKSSTLDPGEYAIG